MGAKDERVIIVKNWQLVLGGLILFGQIVSGYATNTARADETARRVDALEKKKFVEWDTFDNYYNSLKSQLNRIEDRLSK